MLSFFRGNRIDRDRLTNLATCQRALIPLLKLHKELNTTIQNFALVDVVSRLLV